MFNNNNNNNNNKKDSLWLHSQTTKVRTSGAEAKALVFYKKQFGLFK
jgi:hypothetical protein